MTGAVDRRRFLGLLGAGAGGIALAACTKPHHAAKPGRRTTTTTRGAGPASFPAPGAWAAVAPEVVGWEPAALQAAMDFAGRHASRAMVVVVGGRVVAQQAWGVDLGFARDIASVQKSVVALLVGNLAHAGRVELDAPVAEYLGPGWTRATPAQEAAITVRHLLTMTSGLENDFTFGTEPGTVWRYNTNAYQQLPRVVEAASGAPLDVVTRTELFDPIGVSPASRWRERLGLGRLGVDPNGRPTRGLVMTAPDLARVGLLVERGGRWDGRAVLADRRYLAAALDSSQDLNPAYGYLWWLNGKASHVLPGPPVSAPGPLVPDAPGDLVAGLGRDDQKLYVCRSLDLVVTRLGDNAGSSRADALSSFDNELWRRLVAASPNRG